MVNRLHSMTGFAARQGDDGESRWSWEIRGVNARGLDLRLRLPEGMEALEQSLRAAIQGVCARGAITVSLRLSRRAAGGAAVLDPVQLERTLAALRTAEARAEELGLSLREASAAEILALRGVMEAGPLAASDDGALIARLGGDIAPLVAAFAASRAEEGARLAEVLEGQLSAMEALAARAAPLAEARRGRAAETLRENVASLLTALPAREGLPDEGRLAQELAHLAVRADITEEIDRLHAHLAAARELLAAGGAVGRRLDFLTQELNREANTLCAKSADPALTEIGLDLKVLIDRMREQVQNVE